MDETNTRPTVILRPLLPGEYAEPRDPESPFDDFGPRAGYATPPPCSLDDRGALGVAVDGELVGTVSWIWQQWGPSAASRCVMIGISLEKRARGRGIGTEAQRQLAGLVFRHTNSNRVEANTDVENLAEQRSLEKAGFTREGVIRGSHWRDGVHHDSVHYSMLRREWAVARTVPE